MPCFGNMTYQEPDDSELSIVPLELGIGVRKFSVGGLVLCAQYSSQLQRSAADYYADIAHDRILELEKKDVLAPLRSRIESEVSSFITSDLRRLPLFQGRAEVATFTHLDLAPHNVLVSQGTSPKITGILGFELAGFYPLEGEFLNI
jgi:hypothetical protein